MPPSGPLQWDEPDPSIADPSLADYPPDDSDEPVDIGPAPDTMPAQLILFWPGAAGATTIDGTATRTPDGDGWIFRRPGRPRVPAPGDGQSDRLGLADTMEIDETC